MSTHADIIAVIEQAKRLPAKATRMPSLEMLDWKAVKGATRRRQVERPQVLCNRPVRRYLKDRIAYLVLESNA